MFRQAQRRRNISGTASTVVCDGLPKRERVTDANYISSVHRQHYIIPIPPPAGIAGVSSLMLATADSVVRKVEATEVAF